MELAHKYRPANFSGVVGQDMAVAILRNKLANDNLPHVILFTGPTGCGKTTLARITAATLGCKEGDLDYTEINSADVRGIDAMREIGDKMHASSWKPDGKRVWILDEAVQFPKATQQASLKILEDIKPHCYIFLCASETAGMLPTFLGRCFQVNLQPLNMGALHLIIDSVVEAEDRIVPGAVTDAIVDRCGGSARKALQILEAVLTVERDPDAMLAAAGCSTVSAEEKGDFLAKALLSDPVSWPRVRACLEKIDEQGVEGVRRQVLAYFLAVLLSPQNQPKTKARAALVIAAFEDDFHSGGKATMARICWKLCQQNV